MSTGDTGACVYLEWNPILKAVRPCGHLGVRFYRPEEKTDVTFRPVLLGRASWTGLPAIVDAARIVYLCPEHRAFVEDASAPLSVVDNPWSLFEGA